MRTPRIFSAASANCSTISAQAFVCQAHAIHSTLLARKHQKPMPRRRFDVEANSLRDDHRLVQRGRRQQDGELFTTVVRRCHSKNAVCGGSAMVTRICGDLSAIRLVPEQMRLREVSYSSRCTSCGRLSVRTQTNAE